MTNSNTDWELGETRGKPCDVVVVEAAEAITAGDFVRVSGFNTDNQAKVEVQNGGEPPFGVALFAAKTGEMVKILIRGFVKVTFGGTVSGAVPLTVLNNKAVILGTGSAYETSARSVVGLNFGSNKANNETGVIFFGGVA